MAEIIDILFTFFLGAFGFYRMSKGFWLSGIVYLFTGGLIGIGWLIDLIYVITDKPLMWQK
ncbi:MAG: NINE protein [Candidatus Heimdallarchaeota archaeon]